MKPDYTGIIEAAGEPLWWDEFGAPRYAKFTPRIAGNPYAREAVLLEIACQSCGHKFTVSLTGSCPTTKGTELEVNLAAMIKDNSICYGDPPFYDCCPAGYSMLSDTLRVIEYWHFDSDWCWTRCPELEVEINDQY